MNYTRLALAAVVATIVDMVYGFAVYGTALTSDFGRYPDVFRPMDAITAKIPFMIVGTLVAMFAVAYIYAKRSEEHTSELQSRPHLVCRLLLEKKNQHGREYPGAWYSGWHRRRPT